MTVRRGLQTLPDAPPTWDASSREAWNRLIQALENSNLFDKGRRTRPAFIVKGTVSVSTTIDMTAPDLAVLTNIVGKLLVALQGSNFVDVRQQ